MTPTDFPPSGIVHYYFDKWTENGTLLEIHDVLRRKVREQQGRDPEPTAIIINSQTVKTMEAGGERGFDGGKQVKGRKRHLTVDTEGNLLVVQVHPANIHDRDGAEQVLSETHDLNRCRRLSKDFEQHVKNSEAMVYWASIQRMLRRLARPAHQERSISEKRGLWRYERPS